MKPGASQLVYRAVAFTMERIIARRIRVRAVRHWRRMPDAIAPCHPVCKRSSRLMSSKREDIVRPIASKSAIALHLGFPIHKGASFLFLHVKARFVITKPLLATEREQPKAASTSKGTTSTKKQQFDRKIQAESRIFSGKYR